MLKEARMTTARELWLVLSGLCASTGFTHFPFSSCIEGKRAVLRCLDIWYCGPHLSTTVPLCLFSHSSVSLRISAFVMLYNNPQLNLQTYLRLKPREPLWCSLLDAGWRIGYANWSTKRLSRLLLFYVRYFPASWLIRDLPLDVQRATLNYTDWPLNGKLET